MPASSGRAGEVADVRKPSPRSGEHRRARGERRPRTAGSARRAQRAAHAAAAPANSAARRRSRSLPRRRESTDPSSAWCGGASPSVPSDTRRTNRSLIRFRRRVNDEEQQPDEEQAWNAAPDARDLVGAGGERGHRAGHRLPGSSGFSGEREPPVPPAAMATTIVSPMAREKPRISAATMPETAAGTTTRRLVVLLRAPRARRTPRGAHGAPRASRPRRSSRRAGRSGSPRRSRPPAG